MKNHTEGINTLCGQSEVFLNDTPGSKYTNHRSSKSKTLAGSQATSQCPRPSAAEYSAVVRFSLLRLGSCCGSVS